LHFNKTHILLILEKKKATIIINKEVPPLSHCVCFYIITDTRLYCTQETSLYEFTHARYIYVHILHTRAGTLYRLRLSSPIEHAAGDWWTKTFYICIPCHYFWIDIEHMKKLHIIIMRVIYALLFTRLCKFKKCTFGYKTLAKSVINDSL